MRREQNEWRFSLKPFSDDGVLATSPLGKKVFSAIIAEIPSAPGSSTPFYLDFVDVEVATTSFLRDSVVAFRDYVRLHLRHLYPVPANLSDAVREELRAFLVDHSDAIPTCNLSAKGQVTRPEVLGTLDGKQLATLQAVIEAGETDAPTLAQNASTENVGITAWNNRLAALSLKGLVIETAVGRAKRYRPVLENLKYGS